MRSLFPAALSVVLSVSLAGLAGCNSLTEPNEFKVVKEAPKEAPAPAAQAPGAAVMNVPDAKDAAAAPEGAPAKAPRAPMIAPIAAQQPQRPAANAGSCGE